MTQESNDQPLYRVLKDIFQRERAKMSQQSSWAASKERRGDEIRSRARRVLQQLVLPKEGLVQSEPDKPDMGSRRRERS